MVWLENKHAGCRSGGLPFYLTNLSPALPMLLLCMCVLVREGLTQFRFLFLLFPQKHEFYFCAACPQEAYLLHLQGLFHRPFNPQLWAQLLYSLSLPPVRGCSASYSLLCVQDSISMNRLQRHCFRCETSSCFQRIHFLPVTELCQASLQDTPSIKGPLLSN